MIVFKFGFNVYTNKIHVNHAQTNYSMNIHPQVLKTIETLLNSVYTTKVYYYIIKGNIVQQSLDKLGLTTMD